MADLLVMLANKGETGRLDVNLPSSTAQLYLVDGKPVDCCLGQLKGAEALESLLSNTDGSFRFASGIAPPNVMFRKGADRDLRTLSSTNTLPPSLADESITTRPDSEGRFKNTTLVLVLATIAGAVGLTIGSVIANIQHKPNATLSNLKPTSQSFASTAPSASTGQTQLPQSQLKQSTTKPPANTVDPKPESNTKTETSVVTKPPTKNARVLSIPVVLKIEEGRVVEAYAAQPQPGHEAYEATAVRLARQRRFTIKSGTETVYLTITEQ